MSDTITATSDIFIRYLLGSAKNKPILLHFINSILQDSNFEVAKDITLENPFNLKKFIKDKETILDVRAVDKYGRTFNVEIQTYVNTVYSKRSLYYWARIYPAILGKKKFSEKLE